jgi:hypothetical protein
LLQHRLTGNTILKTVKSGTIHEIKYCYFSVSTNYEDFTNMLNDGKEPSVSRCANVTSQSKVCFEFLLYTYQL